MENAAPGTSKTVEVQLTNRLGHDGTFAVETEDFDIDPVENAPRFFEKSDAGPYPARHWITPEVDRLALHHGDRAYITVTISVPADADPGDHEAAVLFQLDTPPGTGGGINVVSRVAALFIITVPGDALRQGAVDGLAVRHQLNWSYPVSFSLHGTNSGSVHMDPTGSVVLRNVFGVPVDAVPVQNWVILRGSQRVYEFSWQPRFALGRYTAETNLSIFGRVSTPISVTFWVLPLVPIIAVLLAILIVSFIVQFFSSRFEFRRKK